MVRIAVFQHVAHEPLGTFHPLLRAAGFRIRYFNYGRKHHEMANMKRYEGLVVLGGPMGVYEGHTYPHLRDEIECIQAALDRDIPILGICLGSQLLAAALGAEVYPGKTKEIGWHEVSLTATGQADPILGRLGASETIFQWHGDTFDLPTGAVHLASSALYANQAFRYGSKAYGLQFHLEVDKPMIERWLTIPVNRPDVDELGGDALAAKIRQGFPLHLPRMEVASRRLFSAVIELFAR